MLTTCTLMLTDDAFAAFLSEINQLAETYMRAPWIRAARQLTLISAPADAPAWVEVDKDGQMDQRIVCSHRQRGRNV